MQLSALPNTRPVTLMPPSGGPVAAPPQPPGELKGSAVPGLGRCQLLRGACPMEPVTVSVILKRPQELRVPAGSKPLTPAEMTRFQASPAQIQSVKDFAREHGLEVASVDPRTRTVKLQGTAMQMGKAFGVHLDLFKDDEGNTFRAYRGGIRLPRTMAGNVEGVLGLDNRPLARPRNSGFSPRTSGGYTPPQVASLYNFPRGTDGTGQTIGIIELGGGYNEADLKAYFQKLGIPEPDVKAVSVDGGQNTPTGKPDSADGEVALDIDVAGAVAPGAKIVVYFANNTLQGFVDAVNQAAHDQENHPNTLSISWGSSEDRFPASARNSFNNVLKDAAAMGVNVFAASGDSGSSDGIPWGGNHVDFPAASPYAIGCGGTQLNSANGQKTTETTWNDMANKGGSGGGGVSKVFPLPDYQAGANVPQATKPGGGRGVPDVAGDAAPSTGYQVLVDGQEGQFGGTSAVAPLWAALTARLGQAVGAPLPFLNPVFYAHPDAFNDVTQGTNGSFSAGPGWDPVTGLGSPDGEKLLAALKTTA